MSQPWWAEHGRNPLPFRPLGGERQREGGEDVNKRHVTRTCGAGYARPEYLTERRAAKQCGTFWQHRFWEHLLRDEHDFCQHLDYLHGNPLKHDLVEQVVDWPWSSFHRWVRHGLYPADWAGTDVDR